MSALRAWTTIPVSGSISRRINRSMHPSSSSPSQGHGAPLTLSTTSAA
eukprot:CAMPEP_0182618260 /NCGR_PEP_ID=MMETSP1330-20130603/45201_1 /TAXON_ID=464278 /ORGANISM="Picochlorum sp., Strain RCC944" /LENGTH=47 /DNA_ID= /DNA_START= /DNA_END= /DNA_ORIENTATION=